MRENIMRNICSIESEALEVDYLEAFWLICRTSICIDFIYERIDKPKYCRFS